MHYELVLWIMVTKKQQISAKVSAFGFRFNPKNFFSASHEGLTRFLVCTTLLTNVLWS